MSRSKDKFRHPPGLYVLFFTEMWERFSFYTMFAVFVLYMTEPADYARLKILPFFDPHVMYAWYSGLIYITPLLGGWIADRFLGCRKTVYIGALLMAAGQFLLATTSVSLFYPGLLLLIVGGGFFKPNISTMVGNLYAHDSPLRDSAFNIFYMGINVGAFIAPLAAGWLQVAYGFRWAFFAAGAGMIVSTIILLAFNRFVAYADTTATGSGGFVSSRPPANRREFRLRMGALYAVYGIIILWWAVYMQYGDVMNLWARDYTRPVKAFGTVMPIEWYQAINPIFIIFFTPVLVWLWGWLNRRGREPSTSGKMQWGFFLSVVSFLIMIGAAGSIAGGRLVSPFWLVGFYGVMTLSELCLSPMGLSYVTKVAPPKYQSLMMGMWFAASGVGSFVAGYLGRMWITPGIQTSFPVQLHPVAYFLLMSGLSIACLAMMGFAFRLVNRAPKL
jgi:POT family proton-dependent oligopeptide transporter